MKHSRTRSRPGLLLSIGIGAASMSVTIVFLQFLHLAPHVQNTPVPAQTDNSHVQPDKIVSSQKKVYSFPAKLTIDKIGVQAAIAPMGITASGNMQAPATNADTGWYQYGARPGNTGTSVIDGHFGLSGEAVFGKLDQLVPGDTYSVTDDQGSVAHYVVTKVAAYDRGSDATEIFNSGEGSHLNLITCNGDWESKQATYSKRLVVFSQSIETPIQ